MKLLWLGLGRVGVPSDVSLHCDQSYVHYVLANAVHQIGGLRSAIDTCTRPGSGISPSGIRTPPQPAYLCALPWCAVGPVADRGEVYHDAPSQIQLCCGLFVKQDWAL